MFVSCSLTVLISSSMVLNLDNIPSVECLIISINDLIFFKMTPTVFACSPDDSASLRTSSATTANPLPYSPAWAASMQHS